MKQRLKFRDHFKVVLDRIKGALPTFVLNGDRLRFKGKWDVEIIHPDGRRVAFACHNMVVDEGANSILGVQFHGDSQITSWFAGLVDNAAFGAFVDADTMGAHGWSESVAYAETARPAWTPGSPAGRNITNGTAFVFTMNANATIHGAFITSDSTKGGAVGTLFSEAAFPTNQTVTAGTLIRLVYSLSC